MRDQIIAELGRMIRDALESNARTVRLVAIVLAIATLVVAWRA
ncbi:MAG TPA: hypothetical protein VK453_05400 [Micromonosporaceae bacterium]|nr:hypothetical protein [Micromonosporaceae bacterium]